jgi:hypothetical protein
MFPSLYVMVIGNSFFHGCVWVVTTGSDRTYPMHQICPGPHRVPMATARSDRTYLTPVWYIRPLGYVRPFVRIQRPRNRVRLDISDPLDMFDPRSGSRAMTVRSVEHIPPVEHVCAWLGSREFPSYRTDISNLHRIYPIQPNSSQFESPIEHIWPWSDISDVLRPQWL